ncbi:polysaccharide deacetylase family protein [Pseudoalteromonas phenolica]|uniref:polysaccharide deacetylase family protein n=1 Tax=Pseudoalteromonas phenolica TaxID=161398 RepID=UPI00207BC729|nr:polysaccharide deacetylase family protein [Pseudoalteromonas phenolica]
MMKGLISGSIAAYALSASVSFAFYPNNAKHAISISFDDARKSQVEVGLPILNKHQVKATFYLMPHHMQGKEKQWKQAAQAGHEIANHTANHLCTGNFQWLRQQNKGLEQVDLNFIKQDIEFAQNYIKQHTGVAAKGFAYPCGQKFVGRGKHVQSYVPIIAETFVYGRTWNDETANDPNYYDPAQIRAFNMDNKSFEEMKSLLELVKFKNAWIVLAGHEVGSEGLYTVKSEALEKLLVYLKDPKNGFWLATVNEVNHYIQNKKMEKPVD